MPTPGTRVGTVTGDWKRVHGVALVPELNKGFITDGDAGNIIVFDLKTLKVDQDDQSAKTTPTGSCTTRRQSASSRLTASSKTATAIDPVKGEVIKSIPLGGAPEQAVCRRQGNDL